MAKSADHPLFSPAHSRYVFLFRLSLKRSHPCVALSVSPEQVVNMSIPISGAKVLLLFDICKFLAKKMHFYPLFRKYTNL